METLTLDIETIKGYFLASVYDQEADAFIDFSINDTQNDLYSFIKFMENKKDTYFITFNGLGFDFQVIQFIYLNNEKWFDKSNLEICNIIWKFAQDLIDDQKYGKLLPFKEEYLFFKVIDIPRIFHWFNENRRVSLKQAEFELRAENIENFEIAHDKVEFTKEEKQDLIFYCHNDVKYTYELYKYVIGKVDHPLYKGKDKIADREIIKNEVGLDCLNWDDVKIGAEWNKKDYLELTKKQEKDLKPTRVEQFYGKKFKQFFPKTVEFKSPELKKFVKDFGDKFIIAKKQEFKYKFNDELTVTLAKGGIHSNEKNRFLKPEEDEYYIQMDIGSQYPNGIRKYKVEPPHLPGWNSLIVSKIDRRIKFKKLYKETKEPKYNSLQEMGKLSLNGGSYGRLNTKGDWQEHPPSMLKVTIGCQLEILMSAEIFISNDIRVVSANTDGLDIIIKKNKLPLLFKLIKEIEEKIGNTTLGQFELTVFEWIAQTSVNDYIAKKIGEFVNGEFKPAKYVEYKQKGDFEIVKELHKNTSFSIFPLAYYKYFVEGIGPEDFINSHNDIFDFCARSNSGSTYYHEGYEKNKSFKLPKLIRYYVSKDGIHIKKIVKDEVDTNANDTNVQPAEELKTVCNKLPKEDYQKHLDNVNRRWYIEKANEVIFAINNGYKPKKRIIFDKNQLSLWN